MLTNEQLQGYLMILIEDIGRIDENWERGHLAAAVTEAVADADMIQDALIQARA